VRAPFLLVLAFLFPWSARAVETLRIALEEKTDTVEVAAKSLRLGIDDEEAGSIAVPKGQALVRVMGARLEIDGAPWPQDALRFRAGPDSDDPERANSAVIRVGNSRLRGDLVVRLHRDRLQLINVLPLEEYLVGVVGAEMPRTFPDEALKAQAVAARTYALKKKLEAFDQPFHLGNGVLHQVYRGLSQGDERIRLAVGQTHGEILTHDLEPIEAYFHASCGGHTESGLAALSRDLPYLQSVECPCGKLAASHWELSIPGGEVRTVFGSRQPGFLRISGRSDTGRVRTVSLGSGHNLDAVDFRQRLGYQRLKSLWFEVNSGDGAEKVRITGRGFGHGAGMCQWGAKAFADRGWSYRQILLHYYPGVEIQQIY
jgi:stage II sporulation protein D